MRRDQFRGISPTGVLQHNAEWRGVGTHLFRAFYAVLSQKLGDVSSRINAFSSSDPDARFAALSSAEQLSSGETERGQSDSRSSHTALVVVSV